MSRLVFISLMGYYPWGGSEELWQKTAIYAKAKGLAVDAHVFKSAMGHPKVDELKKQGVRVFFRKNGLNLFDRIMRKMHLQSFNGGDSDQYWKKILAHPDAFYVISGGTTFDCLHVLPLFNELSARKLRYVYISQHHPEHSAALPATNKETVRGILSGAQKVYFVSARNLYVTERQLALAIPNAEVIFNPVNVNPEHLPVRNSIDKDELKLACVARLECANKGQDMLLEMLGARKWKERNIKVSFFGKGPDAQYLQQLTAYYGIQHMVSFKGHVDDIKTIWREHDALIMSSTAEGTPLALMEAMACARPAVLTDVGGNAEWIRDGYNGFLAAAPTAALLDEAVERMWQNKNRLTELSNNAYNTFQQKYPENAIAYFFNKITQL